MKPWMMIMAAASVLRLAPSIDQKPAWKGALVREGDIVVVRNPAPPAEAEPILALREELSLGGSGASGPAAFSRIADLVVDAAGRIYVLDAKEYRVVVFEPMGRISRLIGAKGQGPGEFNGPIGLSLDEGKGELMVQDAGSRMLYFSLAGEYLRTGVLQERLGQTRIETDGAGSLIVFGGILGVPGSHFTANKEFRLSKYSSEGKLIASIGVFPGHGDLSAYDPNLTVYWEVDRSGRVFFGYPAAYEIRVFGPGNVPTRKILGQGDRVAFSRPEREEAEAKIPPSTRQALGIRIASEHGAFGGLTVDDEGRLFVQTWTKAGDGLYFHDIFDAEGRLVGRAPMPRRAAAIRKGKLFTIEEDADGYPIIKRYGLAWRPSALGLTAGSSPIQTRGL